MINKSNLEAMLKSLGYVASKRKKVLEKKYEQYDCTIEVDFNGGGTIKYPEDKGLKITHHTTCNFSDNENFVVLECVTRLLDKGYRPEHIELEKEWTLGHEAKGGIMRAEQDISLHRLLNQSMRMFFNVTHLTRLIDVGRKASCME